MLELVEQRLDRFQRRHPTMYLSKNQMISFGLTCARLGSSECLGRHRWASLHLGTRYASHPSMRRCPGQRSALMPGGWEFHRKELNFKDCTKASGRPFELTILERKK